MAERTDGMIALIPVDPDPLAVPGGDDPEEIHLTLAYLGEDLDQWTPEQRIAVEQTVRELAGGWPHEIEGRVFGHAVFNPDGGEFKPCTVHLVGDGSDIARLRGEVIERVDTALGGARTLPQQHEPFVPHTTAGYGVPFAALKFTGPVAFDRIRVAMGGDYTDLPVAGAITEGSIVEETKGKRPLPDFIKDKLAKTDKATDDGTYVIETIGDLSNAIKKYKKVTDDDEKAKLRKHIVTNAKRLKATNMLPKNWSETPAEAKEYAWTDAPDSFTAGVLLGLAGLDEPDAEETKAGPPGATYPSPDPRAKKLREYWVHGPGAAKVRWGVSGDFNRCVKHMRKFVGTRAEGLCNIYHRSALGVAPGQEKSLPDGVELKGVDLLWAPDPASKVGWRTARAEWLHVTDPALAAELKHDADMESEWLAAQVEAKSVGTLDAPAAAVEPATTEPAAVEPVEDTLDKFEALADALTTEEVYEEALTNELDWTITGDGELVPEEQSVTSESTATEDALDGVPVETVENATDVEPVEEPEPEIDPEATAEAEALVEQAWGELPPQQDEDDKSGTEQA